MWKGLSPIGSNIGRAFFLSVLFDTIIYPWYSIRITKEKTMAQLNQEHFHVIDSNKARRHEELKKEKEVVFNSSDLNPETKNKMVEFVKTNSTHKLREVVRSFFS